jgi:hypothetical protein
MTDSKWFNGNGFLTEEGNRALLDFRYGLDSLMEKDELRGMSLGEVHALQANLAKLVGDAVSHHLSRRLQEAAALAEMSDQEVEEHLVDKYGLIWEQLTLSPEEAIRAKSLKKAK